MGSVSPKFSQEAQLADSSHTKSRTSGRLPAPKLQRDTAGSRGKCLKQNGELFNLKYHVQKCVNGLLLFSLFEVQKCVNGLLLFSLFDVRCLSSILPDFAPFELNT